MSHKAGPDFFALKNEWSKYKDLILGYYLRPYLAKVKTLNRPILLVDLFAGPGKYGDNSLVSPLILLNAAQGAASLKHQISVLLIEQDAGLFRLLKENVRTFGQLADCRHGSFTDYIDEIANRAAKSTTLLYVDPFSISRLHLGKLARIFQRIDTGSSVELLFVFMANTFMRWAGACLHAESTADAVLGDNLIVDPKHGFSADLAEALWDAESVKTAKYAITSKIELDAIAGGDYWRQFTRGSEDSYPNRLESFVEEYCKQLRSWFTLVCKFPIFARTSNRIPKYWMLFGTRYEPAIDLMNRAMANARQEEYETWQSDSLFADVQMPRQVSRSHLRQLLLEEAVSRGPLQWRKLRWCVSTAALGEFTDSQINGLIKELIADGELSGPAGNRVEDKALLSVTR